MPMTLKVCAPLMIAAILALPAGAAADPAAQAAKKCNVSNYERSLGPTYTTSERVSGVSCQDGRGLITKWDKCRKRNGGADGKCRRPGFSFRCGERRSNVIRTQFDSKVTCKRGDDRVIFTITQFT